MSAIALAEAEVLAPPRLQLPYGVGLRVYTDERLLRQIRAAIFRNVEETEEIARLENVTPETLLWLLEERLLPMGSLRAVALRHGYTLRSWRTTRKHPSKLHVCDRHGLPLCGTQPGANLILMHDGACVTCADQIGVAVPNPVHVLPVAA